MTESTPLLAQLGDTLPEERVTAQTCGACGQPIKHGQIISGARVSPESQEVVGHYACIVQMLGPEKTLQAILAHELPAIDPATLIDGRVSGWEKLFGDDTR